MRVVKYDKLFGDPAHFMIKELAEGNSKCLYSEKHGGGFALAVHKGKDIYITGGEELRSHNTRVARFSISGRRFYELS